MKTYLLVDIAILSNLLLSILLFFLLYKAEMTSVRLSVCLSDRHADSSVVYTWIDVGFGLCRAVVFGM